MATIASLAVNLIAQTNRFTQPLQGAQKTVNAFNSSVDRTTATLQRVDNMTRKATIRFIALKGAMAVATRQATEYAGAIMAVHQQTGLAVESVQGLRFAAERSSTDIATLETGLRSLVRRAAEAAQGNRSFAKGFEQLGVNVRRADGSLKDTETLLMEIADGAASFATEAEASAALMTVMGDAGRRLVPFMRQGSAGIRELMNEAVALGIVMDENAIRTLDALGDQIGTTGNRIGAMSRDIAYRFSPAVSVALGWVNHLIDGFFNLSDEQRQNIVRWTAYIGMVLGAVAAIGVLSRVLIAGMGILRVFATVATVAFSPLALKLLAVGVLVTLAIAHFDDLKRWWENSDFGQIVANAWASLEETWLSDDLTLPQKALETVRITVGAVLGLVESIVDWFLNASIDLVRTVAVSLGVDWEGSKLGQLVDQVQEWWNRENVSLAEKTLGVVAVAASITWAISLLRPFATAVATRAGLAAGTGVARWSFQLGRVAVMGTLVWLLLPDETKEDIKNLWVQLAERIEEFNASTIESPFVDGVAQWLKGLPTDGWELPALAIGATFAGFTLAQSATTLAGMLGAALADLLVGVAIPAVIGLAVISGIGYLFMSSDAKEELQQKIQEIWNDESINLVIKVSSIALEVLDATLEPVADAIRSFEETKPGQIWRTVFDWLGGKSRRSGGVPEFQSGTPWTGDGPLSEIAGVVHRKEAVIPWASLKKGPAGVLEFLGVPGFQSGRGEGLLSAPVFGAATFGPSATLVVQPTFVERMMEALRPTLEGLRPGLTDAILGGLDLLSDGVDQARGMFDELMQAIEQGPQAVEDAIRSVRDFEEELETAARQQAAMNSLVATLLARLPHLNSLLQGMEAGAAFGPLGMALGGLLSLALASESLGNVFKVLMVPLGIVAEVLGLVLTPIIKALFPILRLFGVVILHIARLGAQIWNGFANAVNAVLGWLGVRLSTINIGDINSAIETLTNMTWEEAEAKAGLVDQTEKATQALQRLVNVPLGHRTLQALRFQAQTPSPVVPASISAPQSMSLAGAGAGGGDIILSGPVTVVANDTAEFERELRSLTRRDSLRRTGNPAALQRVGR